MKNRVLCSISTRGRYFTTLPLTINSIINQTRKVDKLIIFDDNDSPLDLRTDSTYVQLFNMMDIKNIPWEVIFSEKKGQHYNHQIANLYGYEFVWRLDDDAIAEPYVLETLLSHMTNNSIGGIGGSVLTPPLRYENLNLSGTIELIDHEPNPQWQTIKQVREVQHLHCSFLYRAGIVDYNLGLSRIGHREESIMSFEMYKKGYTLLVVPNAITWHLKSPTGGIRSFDYKELFDNDEIIFQNLMKYKDNTIVVLDCGMGDHIVFKHVLPKIHNPVIFSCYPEIIPGKSIGEAKTLFGSIEQYNIYRKMIDWRWSGSLEDAFRKLYMKVH